MAYHLGIDLGGTNIAVGLLDESFKIIAKEKCPTRTERDISEIMDDMGKLCNTLMENNNLTPDDIAYIGKINTFFGDCGYNMLCV